MKKLLGLAAVALVLTSGQGHGSDWQQIRTASERTDVSTWVRPVPGNPLNAFRGQTEVPYPMLTALAVLADVENFPAWVFQCHAAQLLPEQGVDLAYIHIKGIWPVADRDAVARTTIDQDPDSLRTEILSVGAENVLAAQPNTVRLPALENRFVFEPLESGWTRVTFETFVDPGGRIPAWLANFVATRAPLTTLQKLHQRLALPQYQIQSREQLPFMLPGAEQMQFPGER